MALSSYHITNGACEDIHHLRLPICSLPAIKKDSRALVYDYESKIIDRSDLILPIVLQS